MRGRRVFVKNSASRKELLQSVNGKILSQFLCMPVCCLHECHEEDADVERTQKQFDDLANAAYTTGPTVPALLTQCCVPY